MGTVPIIQQVPFPGVMGGGGENTHQDSARDILGGVGGVAGLQQGYSTGLNSDQPHLSECLMDVTALV